MANIRRSFGEMVRVIRLSKGLSQEKLAFDCCLHRTYISDVERGIRNVSIDNIEKIADALGVQPKDLFDFTTYDSFRQKSVGGIDNEN